MQPKFSIWDENGHTFNSHYYKGILQPKFSIWDKNGHTFKLQYYKGILQPQFSFWDEIGHTFKSQYYKGFLQPKFSFEMKIGTLSNASVGWPAERLLAAPGPLLDTKYLDADFGFCNPVGRE